MAIEDHGTGPSVGPPPDKLGHKPADMEKEMHGNGIPFSIKHAQRDALCEHLARGVSISGALKLVGISRGTFEEWMWKGGDPASKNKYVLKGDAAREPYRTFALMVRKAEAESEQEAVDIIRGAAPDDWKAAAWLLARRFPDDWGERKPATVVQASASPQGGSTVKVYLPMNGRESSTVEIDDPENPAQEYDSSEEP